MNDENDKLIAEWVAARRRTTGEDGFSERVMAEIRADVVVRPKWSWSGILAKAALVTLAAVLGGARVLLSLEGILGGAN